ncbi:MAG: PHP domain-containing protein [Acidimicrobiales bacterium]
MIDLHTHSRRSDGSDSPARIAELAGVAGLTAVALTDHDRLDGIPEAAEAAARVGVRLVPGCELSCAWDGGACHVLVYFVEPGEGPFQDELAALQDDRARRNRSMLQALRAAGVPIGDDELAAEAGGSGAGRPHVAALLVRKGVVSSMQEAFDLWLGKGRPGYVPKARLSPADVGLMAARSGGLAALAHPLSLGLDRADLEGVVRELAEAGFVGLEADYSRYEPEQRLALHRLAATHGLVATGGSDHHGDYKPDLRVGVGQGDLQVPDSSLEELEARLT